MSIGILLFELLFVLFSVGGYFISIIICIVFGSKVLVFIKRCWKIELNYILYIIVIWWVMKYLIFSIYNKL